MSFPYEFAEKALLGGLMKQPEQFSACRSCLSGEEFVSDTNRLIWGLICENAKEGEACDPASLFLTYTRKVHDGLAVTESHHLKYFDYMMDECWEKAPIAQNLSHYALEVRRTFFAAKMKDISQEISQNLEKGLDISPLVEKIKDLKTQSEKQDTLIAGKAAVELARETMEGLLAIKDRILKTGFESLDSILGGFMPGDFCVIAARPGMGKTQFMLNLVTNLARRDFSTSVVSLEMTLEQILGRCATMQSGVNFRELMRADTSAKHLDSFSRAVYSLESLFAKANFSVSQLTPAALEEQVKRLSDQKKIDICFVDYIQLMSPGGSYDSREREVAAISQAMKLIAKKYGIVMVCLAQLNRAVEARNDKRPMVSDLRDSGSIEQDADQILMLYRDKYYNPQARDTLEVNVVKNRHGETGRCELDADMRRGIFRDQPPRRF